MRGIVKTFPGVRALNGVDLRVRPGEIHGLVGKNGAGKSTLVSILVGLYPPDTGTIVVDGREVAALTPDRAKAAGIAIVPQQVHLLPELSVAENVLCGRLPRTRLGFVAWSRLYRVAAERLAQLGLDLDVHRRVEGLTIAERQIIDIAKALFAEATVIVLDEPTASLPKHEVGRLFGFVRQQRERGTAFIYISHYLEEVFELCDGVTVLRDGRVVGEHPVSELEPARLIRLISGQNLERYRRERRGYGVPVLEIEGLTRPGAYADVELTVHAGEVLGLAGLEGSGKSQLARGLFGLEPIGEGSVRLAGRPYSAASPAEALGQGLGYLPRDRHGLGIVAMRSVAENISLPILRQLTYLGGFLHKPKERELVRRYVDMFDIKTPTIDQPVEFLSGGNQQKVVVAKLAATRPRVLFLDEPTQGVDVQAKVEILKNVAKLAEEGVAIVVVSDEIGELLDVCDRILVMHRGTVAAEFAHGTEAATSQNILLAIEGGLSSR